ncbi:ERF1 methyltransferase catalytic subunit MTQ2 [Colletotrichum spaethianum]|uniref:ERF1 methyltransferase catalytic subunit MTQ2 n=1 Tax=Colletotrichum spaethianum TaxID=700344 RepID=A0AA37UQ94_9PEZI|nr:ERF1 methyltransferase catalytic subunit MTQ2 [Colletotrichum spaethianum]GKT48362.1 ERF1 methyltransferase catalytic subunit MTQ2 [Colletotrichum spaethianum]
MLPTPDTSHVPFERVYEPAEDSYLLLDTLSAPSETEFLASRFGASSSPTPAAPLVVEIGTGSGVVIAFIAAHARTLFGHPHILASGVDLNGHACKATNATVLRARAENPDTASQSWLGAAMGDLTAPLRARSVDVLVFNPPYVPSPELPAQTSGALVADGEKKTTFDEDSYLLSLSYAGGRDGMETTDRLIEALPGVLSERGCAYILLCAQNRPEEVKARIEGFGAGWRAVTVGESGKKAGWEKLQIIRVWRERQQEP